MTLGKLIVFHRRFWLRFVGCFGLWAAVCQPAHAVRIEAGSFTAHRTNAGNPNPVRVTFQNAFDTIPVVIALSDTSGPHAAAIRITNIDANGFDELIIEPDGFDGPHLPQAVHYIAIEPGRHILPDGTIIEAGTAAISAVQHGVGVAGKESWAPVAFSATLPSTPSVMAQIQTANSETRTVASQTSRPFIIATLENPTASGFQLALDRNEASSGPIPSTETVGWIAFPAGGTGSFPDISNNAVNWSAVNTGVNIRGWGNGCYTNAFGLSSGSAIVVAKKNSHIGGDGGWLRRCSLSSTMIGLTVDEDTARDTERNHGEESAAIIAFSQSFHANLVPDITVIKDSISFADALGTDFALPGATVEYLVSVTNGGNSTADPDTLIVTEALPSEVDLLITDYGLPGSGPIDFAQATPASGLACAFAGFASTTDCFDFSTDGTDFTYQPSDSGDGTDPAVTHVRVAPTGYILPDTGGGSPGFELRFQVKIQ